MQVKNERFVGRENSNAAAQRAVEDAWENFLAKGEEPATPVRSVVWNSWQRCLANGVGASAQDVRIASFSDQLDEIRHDNRHLTAAFEGQKLHLTEIVDDLDSVILLTDAKGVVFDTFGNEKLLSRAKSELIAPGYSWGEGLAGTNAIGTAIELKQAVEIHACEHFCEPVKSWSCSAAPITDPVDGELLGVLDVTSLREKYNSRSIALAVTTARQIEEKLRSHELIRRMELTEWYHDRRHRWGHDGVIILDRLGRVVRVDGRARELLGGDHLPPEFSEGKRLVNGEATAENMSGLFPKSVRPRGVEALVRDGKWQGGLLVLSKTGTSQSARLSQVHSAFDTIVGSSPAISAAKIRASKIARSPAPVLIHGETGCGKELFSRAIHDASAVSDGPFIAINCGALRGDLVASELFGYEGGAFTGASSKGRIGKFEEADGGTIFLDEIGELPLDIQVVLLRVVQDGVVVRLGSSKERKISARIIAATNRDLMEEVEAGGFRSDLFYRLKIMDLRLPPLREHPGDIELLSKVFLDSFASQYDQGEKTLAPELLDLFRRQAWPGNIRELRGVLESMYVLSDQDVLSIEDFDPLHQDDALARQIVSHNQFNSADLSLSDMERAAILQEIERQDGNFSEVARRLGIARSTLYRKMSEYGIDRN